MAHAHEHPEILSSSNSEATARRLRYGLVLTLLFVVLEALAGGVSHSIALVSDAGHNLTDALTLGLTLWTFGLATHPPTAARTFGLHRAGVLAALANAAVLVVIAVGIFVEAYLRLRSPGSVDALLMTGVAAVALVLNLAIALWLHGASGHDLNVRASFVHFVGDAAAAVGVVVAGIAIAVTGQSWLDPAVSVLIGVFILWSSRGVLLDTIHVLLEGTPTDLNVHLVQSELAQVPGVLAVHDLHIWSVSSSLRAASAHVLVQDQPVSQACGILSSVNEVLAHRFDVAHSSLQLETTSCDPSDVFCHLGEHTCAADPVSSAGSSGQRGA